MDNASFMAVVDSFDQLFEPAATAYFVDVLIFADDIQKAAVFRIFHHYVYPVKVSDTTKISLKSLLHFLFEKRFGVASFKKVT